MFEEKDPQKFVNLSAHSRRSPPKNDTKTVLLKVICY